MEPVPESERIVQQLRAIGSELSGLADLVHDIQRLVPDLVGLSLTLLEEDLTVTFVRTGSPVARLDSLHLLQGQPEPAAREAQENLAYLDSRARSRRTAAEVEAEVASSLHLPLVDRRAALDLYASSPGSFDGLVATLAALCGASAGEAVADSDLAFRTRLRAAVAPVQVAEWDDIDLAVGLVAADLDLDSRDVESRLRDTAERSGVSLLHLARFVIDRTLP